MTRALQKTIFGAAFAFALTLLVGTTGYRIGAGEKDSKQNDGKVAPPSDKGTVNKTNKWFADPKRGWIRSEEREEQKRRAAQQERNEHSTREKTGGIIWEY